MLVDVVIDNRTAVLSGPQEAMEMLSDWWSYFFPSARFTPTYQIYVKSKKLIESKKATGQIPKDAKVQPQGWDGRIRMMRRGCVPAGLFRATFKDAQRELGISFKIKAAWPEMQEFAEGFDSGNDEKYRYQDDCVTAMCRALQKGGGIILAATSAGKTRITASFFSKIPHLNRLFVVDQLNLLYQAQQELARWLGCEIGIVGDGERQFFPSNVTVATIQTLHKQSRDPRFSGWMQSLDVVVMDELHEQLAKRNSEMLKDILPLAVYGLTATLEMGKKDVRMRAFAFSGPVIFRFPVAEGMERTVLNRGRVLQLQFEAVDAYADNYQEEYKIQVVENQVKERAAKLITDYLIKQNRYVMQLVSRIAHLERLHAFQEDIPHGIAFGEVKKKKREENMAAFEAGAIRLMIANAVFKKGVNIRRADAALDMAEQKSKNDTLQKFGRLLRLHDDKHISIYIDFSTQKEEAIKRVGNEIERVMVSGRFTKAGNSRRRAFRDADIAVKVVKVSTPEEALQAVKKFIKKLEGEDAN